MIKTSLRKLERLYGIQIAEDPVEYTDRILPYRFAPVIVPSDDGLIIKNMSFSLIPSWSKEPKVKFATHNARLETIDSKPTWKGPFQTKRCLVPMTTFIEPIYEGEYAGFMISFQCRDEGTMFAAGIYDRWINKNTGEVIESFAVITSDPIPFVKEIGHDRTPVFVQDKAWKKWLQPIQQEAADLKILLANNVAPVELEVVRDRPMRPGWEKRK